METLRYKPSKKGYILDSYGDIETIQYKDYLREFGGDETTTPNGIAPRLFLDGKTVMTWGVRGNNLRAYKHCDTKTEAKNFLFAVWEGNIEEECEFVYFATSKNDLYNYLAETHEKDVKVIKRFFKIQNAEKEKLRLSKIKHDNRPRFTPEMMRKYIADNKEMVQTSLKELDELKQAENKEIWQIKANVLIQKVSNNDFRFLKWKEIYNLIRDSQ